MTQICSVQFQKVIPEVQILLLTAVPNPILVSIVQVAVADRAVQAVTADVQAAAMVIANTVVKELVTMVVTVIVKTVALEHAPDIVIITA